MTPGNRYRVTVSRRGPPARPFGWEICRSEDGTEIRRSTDTFRARHEAIAAAESVARTLDAAPANET